MENAKIPSTLEEAFELLSEMLPPEDARRFKNREEKEARALAHLGLGAWIRNNWQLWDQSSGLSFYFVSLGIQHPDDQSGIILTSYHRHLNARPIELEKQVETRRQYWKAQGLNPDRLMDRGGE